ncbi:MAG TPA: 5'/3'-nucleotidase SurE [Acidimicrobiales bacterium]|nr:5'/3'-nucleotidase SurE [Acidimicrobiales bacterium]
MPRILVTNDDGITSEGLVVLARMARELGEVVVVAPDQEFSGASAALGPLHLIHPEVHEAAVQGIDEAWAVSGPPALCVYFARLGAFGGAPFDLVLAGINPGANVGRSVQHSGTVGAVITAASGRLSGVAVSQAVAGASIEGQGAGDQLAGQRWETAARVGVEVARGVLEAGPSPAVAVNVNVPNVGLDELAGWRRTTLAPAPSRGVGRAELVPVPGRTGSYTVVMQWADASDLPADSDGGAVARGLVSVSLLTHIGADPESPLPGGDALDRLLDAGGPVSR